MENEEPVLLLAKDCLLTGQEQACTRMNRLFGCHNADYSSMHRKMVLECHIVIISTGDTLFQTRPGMRKNWSSQSFA